MRADGRDVMTFPPAKLYDFRGSGHNATVLGRLRRRRAAARRRWFRGTSDRSRQAIPARCVRANRAGDAAGIDHLARPVGTRRVEADAAAITHRGTSGSRGRRSARRGHCRLTMPSSECSIRKTRPSAASSTCRSSRTAPVPHTSIVGARAAASCAFSISAGTTWPQAVSCRPDRRGWPAWPR